MTLLHEASANTKENLVQFRLSTMIWAVVVAAACLATWRHNAVFAPLVSTSFAALFLVRESRAPERSTAKLAKIGAFSAGIGTFAYMVAVSFLDLAAVLSFPGEFPDVAMLLRFVTVAVAFTLLYAALASCLGAVYGLCCAVVLRLTSRDAISRQH